MLRVEPDGSEWRVVRLGIAGEEARFDRRGDAVDWACRVALRRAPGSVDVMDSSGQISARYSFDAAKAA
jgi:hypothetical protein